MYSEKKESLLEGNRINQTEVDRSVKWNESWLIHRLIEIQVQDRPDALAVQYGERHLTYREINNKANQLAHFLKKLGVGPEVVVGVYMHHSPEAVITMLGILKAGGAYLPLDLIYPPDRVHFILSDSHVEILLMQEKQQSDFSNYCANVLYLSEISDSLEYESQENIVTEISDKNLAYIIYTSGSTGYPKGVQIEHKSLLNLIYWHLHTFEISALDRAGLVASFSFDASIWSLWPYLAVGASFHLPDKEDNRIIADLLYEWIAAQQITIGFFPTPLAEHLLALEWPNTTNFRILLTGGDKLHSYPRPSLPFKVINNYGTTENTVVATSGIVASQKTINTMPSIGYPIRNTQVYILDDAFQTTSIDTPGELYIGGLGLARGYYNRPDLTAERFLPDPFSSEPGSRLYKTGDQACRQIDNSIRFLGRVDQQIKIRGFRVEPGEIEALLNAHTKIQESAVVGWEQEQEGISLISYIVLQQGAEITSDELHSYLKKFLPVYMLPSKYVFVTAIPLNVHGKVDLKGLPDTDEAITSEREICGPDFSLTPLEKELCKIWCQILNVEQVERSDNFFKLEGHSLSIVQLLLQIRSTFNVSFSVREIYDAPTLMQMAAVIAEKRDKHHQEEAQRE